MNRYQELFSKLHPTTPLTKNSNILIVDGTNTFIRIWSNVPSMNDNGDHVGGVVGFLRSIGALIRREMPTRCIIVFDGVGGSQRRRKLYPEYKANRKNKVKLNRFDEFRDLQDEAESIKKQFNRIIQYLDTLPITLICIDNIEADDTIAYLVNYHKQFDSKVTICSTDKDFLQLVNDNVSVYSPVKKITYTPKLVEEEFGFTNKNYLIYKTLQGDSSDNIPGVKGVGLKTFLKHYPEIITEELNVNSFIEKTKDKLKINPKVKILQDILNAENQIKLNYNLMQLNESIISGQAKLNIQNKIQQKYTLDNKTFLKLYFDDGLNTMIKDPHSWLSNTFNRLLVYANQ